MPKHVSAHRDRHGKIRYKFRKVGCRSVYIHGEPGTPEFDDQVDKARRDQLADEREDRSISALKALKGISLVYFIGNPHGPVKIGFTTDIFNRVISLQIGSPMLLQVLGVIPGTRELETHLHSQFSTSKVRGEWFAITPELAQTIEDLANPPHKVIQIISKSRSLSNI